MAQMNHLHAPSGANPGERVVFNALKNGLPDNYYGMYEPTLFGEKHSSRPDFVLIGEDIGLIILEVKDWGINSINTANRDSFVISNGANKVTRTNPEKQAQGQVDALKDEIARYRQTDPQKYDQLIEKHGQHKGKLKVPFSYLIVFPNITRQALDQSNVQLFHVLNENKILLIDDLSPGRLLRRLRGAPIFTSSLTSKQIDVIKWMLYPEIRISKSQSELFVLNQEQIGLTSVDTYLPEQAKTISKKLRAKLVRGVVGSGKTLVLLFRAKYLSEVNPNWRILVLAYNKPLMDYLRKVFEQIGGDLNKVEIVNFHKWCRDLSSFNSPQSAESQIGLIQKIINDTGINTFDAEFLAEEFNWIKEQLNYKDWDHYLQPDKIQRTGRGRGLGGDEKQRRAIIYKLFKSYQTHLERIRSCDWADVPVRVLRGLDNGEILPEQYHAILIDEAQDFAPSWFRVAFRMIKPETNMIFIVGDGTQKIYKRGFTWKELGLWISSQNSFELKRTYRSTREIIDIALEVISDSHTLREELDQTGDSLVEPDKEYNRFQHGPLPVILNFASPEKEYAAMADQVYSLTQQGFLAQDIAILMRHRNGREEIIKELRKRGIPCTILKGNSSAPGTGVSVMTLHGSKGLEFEIVMICGLEEFGVDGAVDIQSIEFQQQLDQERKLLYVGMTRARQRLFISYSGEGPEWIVRRLEDKLEQMRSV